MLNGEPIDLGRIKLDVYAVGAEKDHIVPWDSAWRITQLAGGKVRYVLASSGHIAGIINPPGGKGTYWVDDERGTRRPRSGARRRRRTTEAGGPTGSSGSPRTRARRRRRRRWAAPSIRRSTTRRDDTCWRSRDRFS